MGKEPPGRGPNPGPQLSGLFLIQFVSGLSATVVATALPVIMGVLHTGSAASTWLVAATILANTTTTPLWGKLGDLFNRRTVLLCSITVFCAACVMAAAAADFTGLLVARVLMGVGLGGIGALCMVVVASLVEPRQRGRYSGYVLSAQTLGTMAGPAAGGFIAGLHPQGWRGCFLLVLPFGLLAWIIIRFMLPSKDLQPPARAASAEKPDVAGGLLLMTGVALTLLCVTHAAQSGGAWSVPVVAAGLAGLTLLGVASVFEWRAPDPVVPLRLLRGRPLGLSCLAAFAIGCTLFGGSVFISQYLQLGLLMPSSAAGLLLMPMAAGTLAAAAASGRWIAAGLSIRTLLIASTGSVVAGFGVLTAVNSSPVPLAVAGTILLGLGTGSTLQNLVIAAQHSAPAGMLSSVSATVMFFFSLGGSVGLIVLGALLSRWLNDAGQDSSSAYLAAIPQVFLISAGIAALGCAAVFVLPRRNRAPQPAQLNPVSPTYPQEHP